MNGIILTINQAGRFSNPVSNTSSKEERSKIMCSPFEIIKGRETITPKGNYKSSNNFTERAMTKCVKKVNISKEIVDIWLKEKNGNKEFKKMKIEQQIAQVIQSFDEGYGVSFEML